MMKSLMRDIRGWAIIVGVVFYGVAAWAQIPDAAAPVRRLYATYGTGAATTASGFRDQDAANLFSRSLLALYRRAAKAGLDYDFFVQGQDFNLAKPLDVTRVDSNRDRATVSATLTQTDVDSQGKQKARIDRFEFAVIKEAGAWRIDDATHSGSTFRRELQDIVKSGGMR